MFIDFKKFYCLIKVNYYYFHPYLKFFFCRILILLIRELYYLCWVIIFMNDFEINPVTVFLIYLSSKHYSLMKAY